MPKYSSPKQVVGVSAPSKEDPRPEQKGKHVTGMWYGGGPQDWADGEYYTFTYADGSQEVRFFYQGQGPETGHNGVFIQSVGTDPDQARDYLEDQAGPKRTPEQERRDKQLADEGERQGRQSQREEEERQRNQELHGQYMTNKEYQDFTNAQEREKRAAEDQQRQMAQQDRANQIAQGNLDIARQKANQPNFLAQAGEDNPYLIRYNPQTDQLEQMQNPNFDAVKQQGERLRQLLSTQIQARQVTLEEAKQQYTQWFDQNVKIPMAQAQEQRDRAAEQRAALDAEERRRQFAADFSLQRGQLGQRAGEAAMQAEQSLLPYRAGPTEAAEMSSAINSLAGGGKMDANASAGINFTPGAFQFNAPDFKQIAKDAAASALKGISSYKPSKDSYQTADYSGVGSIGGAGAAPTMPSGYGDFSDIINQLQSTYQFGGNQQ